MNIVELTDAIAEKAHANQKRWSGEPYIVHPRAVRLTANKWLNEYFNNQEKFSKEHYRIWNFLYLHDLRGVFPVNREDFIDIVEIVSLYHDAEEDQKENGFTIDFLISELAKSDFGKHHTKYFDTIRLALKAITKTEGQDYLEYLKGVKNNKISRIVKLADLEDNLKDLKPGNQRDKYLLAREFLLN